jgi:hypothetical protein
MSERFEEKGDKPAYVKKREDAAAHARERQQGQESVGAINAIAISFPLTKRHNAARTRRRLFEKKLL